MTTYPYINISKSGSSTQNTTAYPLKTGQTVSYGSGSDGDVQSGRDVDFFTLDENNPFGNTLRFTDVNGTQVWTSGDIIIDWAQYEPKTGKVLFILIDRTGNTNWSNCLSQATSRTNHGYNDWRLLTPMEYQNLVYYEVGQTFAFDYSPMNLMLFGAAIWLSTTYPRNSDRAISATLTTFSMTGSTTKSTSIRGCICRTGNVSELTIP